MLSKLPRRRVFRPRRNGETHIMCVNQLLVACTSRMSLQPPQPSPKKGKKAIKIVLKKGGSKRKYSPSPGNASSKSVPALFRSVPTPAAAAGDAEDKQSMYGTLPPLDDGDFDLPCDTLLALRSLVSKGAAAVCPLRTNTTTAGLPFVLKPMLHHALLSSVSLQPNPERGNGGTNVEETNKILSAGAATGVTVELDDLRRQNIVRLLQLQGTGSVEDSGNDIAIMETHFFERGVRDAFVLLEEVDDDHITKQAFPSAGDDLRQYSNDICQWFLDNLSSWNQAFVNYDAIHLSLASLTAPCRYASRVIDYLVGIGLLLPRRASSASTRLSDRSYWFTLPGLGKASKSIAESRCRVLNKIRRSNYGEIKRSVLEAGMMPSSRKFEPGKSLVAHNLDQQGSNSVELAMPAAFCIRDLLSRGQITIHETPAGQFVRVGQGVGEGGRTKKKRNF